MGELPFDRGEVIKNIGMVKLEVVQDGRAWSVMYELTSLIKKGGVVFIGLNDE